MKKLNVVLLVLLFSSCVREVVEKKTDRLYFLGSCHSDTEFIDKPKFDTTKLTVIDRQDFDDFRGRRFNKQVIKLTNEPAPVDGGVVFFLTSAFGIIY
jgi:hypothetical protein